MKPNKDPINFDLLREEYDTEVNIEPFYYGNESILERCNVSDFKYNEHIYKRYGDEWIQCTETIEFIRFISWDEVEIIYKKHMNY